MPAVPHGVVAVPQIPDHLDHLVDGVEVGEMPPGRLGVLSPALLVGGPVIRPLSEDGVALARHSTTSSMYFWRLNGSSCPQSMSHLAASMSVTYRAESCAPCHCDSVRM